MYADVCTFQARARSESNKERKVDHGDVSRHSSSVVFIVALHCSVHSTVGKWTLAIERIQIFKMKHKTNQIISHVIYLGVSVLNLHCYVVCVWITRVWINEHTLIRSGCPSICPFVFVSFPLVCVFLSVCSWFEIILIWNSNAYQLQLLYLLLLCYRVIMAIKLQKNNCVKKRRTHLRESRSLPIWCT